jgi:hypothetical protein
MERDPARDPLIRLAEATANGRLRQLIKNMQSVGVAQGMALGNRRS